MKGLEFFLNVSRVAARLMSVGRVFHRRGAAELKARSSTAQYNQFRICHRAQISLTLQSGDWLQHVGNVRWCSTVQLLVR